MLFRSDIPFQRWIRIGRQLTRISESSGWWLGDWLVYGENSYPDRYREAVKRTALDYQTLRNYAWIARRFDQSRRRAALSLGHHMEVAALTPAQQDLLLLRAEQEGWSRNVLRKQVRLAKGADPAPLPAPATAPALTARAEHPPGSAADPERPERVVALRTTPDQRQRWHRAAELMNTDLTEWAAAVLDGAAQTVLEN
ncbi:LmbU family transcriptional regulator [Streptomyces sp. NPDC001985]|uniref:LmbU family transcriptional regulator n=1 Tax=Streptomyces sp. NPDC001985 TaxID=3154406 RepID=UPI003318B1B3